MILHLRRVAGFSRWEPEPGLRVVRPVADSEFYCEPRALFGLSPIAVKTEIWPMDWRTPNLDSRHGF